MTQVKNQRKGSLPNRCKRKPNKAKRRDYLKKNPYFAMKLAWKRGLLKYKLYDFQHDLYEIFEISQHRLTVVNAARRWGKTTVAILYALIYGLTHPNSQIKIATKTQKSLKKTINPILRILMADMPKGLVKWSGKDDCYKFYNGSEMHIHGTDMQRFEGLRGQRCDLGIVDEAAFCSSLRYIVLSVLMPQTLTCKGSAGRIILLSTPEQKATQSGEEFKQFCIDAQMHGSYFSKTIYDNKSLTSETIEEYKAACGGEDSVEWQVEYLVKFLIDPEKAIVPEWRTDKFLTPDDFDPNKDPYFQFYHKYTCLDLGVKRDFTVGLNGYYDFKDATLYILNEFHIKNTTTPDIAKRLLKSEKDVFGEYSIYRRVCDSDNPQLVNDFVHLHKIGISAVEKTTLEAMVNSMRMMVGDGQLKVHPRCKLLIKTLEYATWADSEQGRLKKDFARTKELGHMDAVAALMYFIRSLNKFTNPVPTTYGLSLGNILISNTSGESHNKTEFRKAFVTPARRNKSRRRN
jgi:hypothetical protein